MLTSVTVLYLVIAVVEPVEVTITTGVIIGFNPRVLPYAGGTKTPPEFSESKVKEAKVTAKKRRGFVSRHFSCLRYGIPVKDWLRFAFTMRFAGGMEY